MLHLCAAALSLLCACSGGSGTSTPLGKLELAAVLRDSHHAVFGHVPSMNRLAVGWAQATIEGARRSKCWNIGSVSAMGEQPFFLVAGHRFRSSVDAIDGARVYWRAVCGSALKHFDSGDADGAARQLKTCGYYSADVEFYSREMVKLTREAMHSVIPKL